MEHPGAGAATDTIGGLAIVVPTVPCGTSLDAVARLLQGRAVPAVAVRWPAGTVGVLTHERMTAILAPEGDERHSSSRGLTAGACAVRARVVDAEMRVDALVGLLRDDVGAGEFAVEHRNGEVGVVPVGAILDGVTRTLAHRALHDPLTGLPNRALLVERLRHLHGRRVPEPAVLLFLDLDEFKAVNDTLGHEAGDTVLVEVGRRLLSCVREHDTVSRLGGDEFVVLLEEIDHVEDADVIARRMREAVARPMVVRGRTLRMRTSIGLAVVDVEADSVDELLDRADQAMYGAKHGSPDGLRWYRPPGRIRVSPTSDRLLAAVDGEGLEVWFQPRVDAGTGRLVGVHALVRWRDGDDWIPSSQVIAAASRAGFLHDLQRLVLQKAAATVAALPRAFHGLVLTVPVHQAAIDANLLVDVAGALALTGLEPERLRLEIDDASLPDVMGSVADRLHDLRALGVGVGLHGFGGGQVSLLRLADLPVDEVRLDPVMLHRAANRRARVVVEDVVTTLRRLGMVVIATGVESEELADVARELSCDLLQGHHCGRPMRGDLLQVYPGTLPPAGSLVAVV